MERKQMERSAATGENPRVPLRRKVRRYGLVWVFVAVFLMVGSVVSLGLILNQDRQMERIRQHAVEAEADYQAALERNLKAHDTLESIGTDAYIEKIARDQLGMVKPGERVFNTVD
jgi:cell division protein FtsB